MPTVSREYKDRLFNFIFGREENKAWTLNLYNAVNGTSYSDTELISINTIREVLYLGMHNDVSFLIAGEINLYEQQSSYNPNMPLRLLQYLGNLFEKYITERNLNKYGSTLIMLPVPKLVVFYNGEKEQPDESVLRLSDAFSTGAEGSEAGAESDVSVSVEADVEVVVRMINVNQGRSPNLLESCQPLKEYAWLMQRIRENIKVNQDNGVDKELIVIKAVDQAVEETPKDYLLKPFLDAHRAEVQGMLLTEYNEAEAMKLFEMDGERKKTVEVANSMYDDGLEPERIARILKLKVTDVEVMLGLRKMA